MQIIPQIVETITMSVILGQLIFRADKILEIFNTKKEKIIIWIITITLSILYSLSVIYMKHMYNSNKEFLIALSIKIVLGFVISLFFKENKDNKETEEEVQ